MVSIYEYREWMDLLVAAGGMEYHRARSLNGKLSQVISESRSSAIARERKESARSKRVEKQRKVVKELWDSDRRSMVYDVEDQASASILLGK
jgi:hypothetical protein